MPKRVIAALYALIGALIVVSWWGAVSGEPIFDDPFLVTSSACFDSLAGLRRTLSFASGDYCAYRPLRYVSYGIDYWFGRGDFAAYHVGNIVRHVLVMLAAGGLATIVFGTREDGRIRPDRRAILAGATVALLWAMHPVQTDSVSYVSGRRDILAGLWTFVATGSAIWARERGGLWWLLPLWATLFGFMSKESTVIIPVVAALWMLRGDEVSRVMREHRGVLFALAVGLLLAVLYVLQRGVFQSYSQRDLFEWWGGSFLSNLATVAMLQVQYLRHALMLAPLIGDYYPDTIPLAYSLADGRALLGLALVFSILGGAAWLWRREPVAAWGLLFWLVGLAPVSHLIPHHELYAEHYLYIPLFGLMVALVSLAMRLVRLAPEPGRARTAARLFLAAAVALMAVQVVARNADWQNERVFYEEVVSHAPMNARAQGNLLFIYGDLGDWERMSVPCALLAARWTSTGEQGRTALARCADVAIQVGDMRSAHRYATQLVQFSPELGAGHRRLAMASAGLGLCDEALRATRDWASLTRASQSVRVMTSLLMQCPESTPEQRQWALDTVALALPLDPAEVPGLSTALLRHGDLGRALTALLQVETPFTAWPMSMKCLAWRLARREAPVALGCNTLQQAGMPER